MRRAVARPHAPVPLPKDALLVELRAEALTFETRECLLPGTMVRFGLVMEGHPLSLRAPVEACLVVDKDRAGYLYQPRLSLEGLAEADRHLIALFIGKGRGHPGLEAPPS